MLTAAARALYRDQPPPWVLEDPYATGLAGPDGRAMIEDLRTRLSPEKLDGFVRWVAARGRFTEDLVARSVDHGIGQYVILGAGLDSFAYRHPRMLERIKVFEVDHPASQAWKRERLAQLGVVIDARLVFAAVDFEAQSLREGLHAAGFDFSLPAVFSWIGVTMYLTMEAIRATLHDVSTAAPGSRLVMTYNQPFETLDDFSRQVTSELATAVGEGGEPFLTLFTPDQARSLMSSFGFDEIDDFGPAEMRRLYFDADAKVRIPGAQRIIAGTLSA